MKKKTIAFDFDDVICDISKAFLNFNRKRYKKSIQYHRATEYDLYKILDLSPAEEIRRWDEFFKSPQFCYPAPEKDLKRSLKLLKKKYKLVLLTARSKPWQGQVRKWISKYLPNIFDKGIFSQNFKSADNSKGSICRQQQIFTLIDDNPKEINSCLKYGSKIIVFTQPWNQKISKFVPRIKSLKQLPKFL